MGTVWVYDFFLSVLTKSQRGWVRRGEGEVERENILCKLLVCRTVTV